MARVFGTEYWRDIPFNVNMTVPYGAVTSSELNAGGTLNYQNDFAHGVSVDLTAGGTYDQSNLLDVSNCVYNWYGDCILKHRFSSGEIEGTPLNAYQWEDSLFGRFNATWRIAPQHTLRVSAAPTFTTAWGQERALPTPGSLDPLSAHKYLTSAVGGVEYELHLFDERLQNIAFAKLYEQEARAVVPVFAKILAAHDHGANRGGFGEALRYRVEDWIWLKASYELATRLPSAEEVFGNGMLVMANLDLEPETSQNGNLSVTIDARHTPAGWFRLDVNGFVRDASHLIVLLGSGTQFYSYANVYGAQSAGVEPSAGWTSPHDWVAIDGNVTWQDFRNTSTQGEFAQFAGERIPNRPWLFANGSLRLQYKEIATATDEASVSFIVRYVNGFYPGWESAGIPSSKLTVPSQVLCSLGLIYRVPIDSVRFTFTGEVQNMFDQPAYDFFGVQKPGRAFYFKVTAAF